MASVQLASPIPSLFTFPPHGEPPTLPPPIPGSAAFAPPFAISPSLYNAALDVKVPITIACLYAVTVFSLNAYNKSRQNKPWAISKTKGFFAFVVAHNIFLAAYSAWTFVGMLGALQRSLKHPSGLSGLAGTVDSLCKIHGTSGLGNGIAYDPTTSGWISQSNSTISLTSSGNPHSTDAGRLWNEGLAFYGWFFYLSKFYEVLDTAIILAKGKKSSTLQTYHHAGAMMCMWAGIRFMSPPIWMFCFVNSGIHALMYTYYTLTAFAIPIPGVLKRSLTTMQIVQFLIGASFATLHSFVFYTIPVQVLVIEAVEHVTSLAPAVITATATSVLTTSSTGVGSVIKKFLYRAAGEEGLAANVAGVYSPSPPGPSEPQIASLPHPNPITQYRTEYKTIPCVDTSGQTFAIWLNVLYLTPLTWLFVRFFIKSYSRRGQKTGKGIKADAGFRGELYPNGKTNGHGNGHANGYGNRNGYANGNGNGKN